MSNLFDRILIDFSAHAHPEQVQPMVDYMKGRFDFYGIKSPERKELAKRYHPEVKVLTKKETFALVKRMWDEPKRELHYTAMEFLFRNKKFLNEKSDIDFLQGLATQHSWWDSIDFIAPKLMKIYFDAFPEMRNPKVDEWVKSGNIWLQRCALLIHLHQKEKVDLSYMFETILRLNNTKEFFVDKAIGWILREHAKRSPKIIQAFIEDHRSQLSNLSVREGLKHFN